MAPADADPTDIRSIAVTVEDVVTAVEARRTTDRDVVLRITPPFAGRMRARLHDRSADPPAGAEGDPEEDTTRSVHVEPQRLLAESAPPYPSPDTTEDELRRDETVEYDLDRHRRRHAEAVADWRVAVAAELCESVTIDIPGGTVAVQVHALGRFPAD